MKIICPLFILLFVFSSVTAQQQRIRFSSFTSAGLLLGAEMSAISFETVNGISKKNWFAGIGIAYDSYLYNSFPIFVSVKKVFNTGKGGFLLYADGGSQLMTNKDVWANGFERHEKKPGYYLDAGAGFVFKSKGKARFFVSAGNTVKQILDITTSLDTGFPSKKTYRYNYSRLVLRMGIRF